mmetsp:Transcript_8129/g.19532  ORF Transcript_8129/g.19532 Transcript_8129/m.19532 type:complete len:101 (+) Transcript_8129:60-362(+)
MVLCSFSSYSLPTVATNSQVNACNHATPAPVRCVEADCPATGVAVCQTEFLSDRSFSNDAAYQRIWNPSDQLHQTLSTMAGWAVMGIYLEMAHNMSSWKI